MPARMAPILPLLQRRGLRFQEREAGNHAVDKYLGLIVKDSYWRWPERDLAGNIHHVLRGHRLLRQNPGSVLQRRHARDLPPLKYSNTHWRHIHSAVAKAMADKTTPVGQ